jgi:ABC-2 type transport system permease protein
MSTALTSLAIATAFERRYGVLKRLGASPLPREGLLLAKIAALLCIETVQLGVICAAGLALGWHPHGGFATVTSCLVLVVTGTAAFASLGLLLAGTLRAEATLAAANLVSVLLLVVGAVVVPLASYPEALQPVVSVLPSAALAEGLRDVCSGAGLESGRVAVLVVWALLAGTLTTRTFRWE